MKQLFVLIYVSLSIGLLGCNEPQKEFDAAALDNPNIDLYIKGGSLIDGTGSPARLADILVRGDEIIYVGKVDAEQLNIKTEVDAAGMTIAPGFIDAHSHGDPLRTPKFDNFLAMGVTTISLGQDGFSAPFKDLKIWMDSVGQKKPGTNILPYVGHGTLREFSGIRFKTEPSEAEITEMGKFLKNALEAGSWGMSTGLEYTPGIYAGAEELEALAKIVGEYGGIIMSHIRNEDDDQVEKSINELLKQGRHCKVHVSHMKSVYGRGIERAEELLAVLDSARNEGIKITADVYPYAASYTGIGIVFPKWAKAPNDFEEVKRTRRAELEEYLLKRVSKRNGPEATLFGSGAYAGRTLGQAAQSAQKSFPNFLIDDIGPSGASAAYFVMNDTLQERLVQDPNVMIGSDGSPTGRHPRGHGTFAKIIEEYVIEKQLFSLEEAIYKMSGLTAETIGLKDRGKIAAGMKADILIFDPNKIKETATYAAPFQLAEGMDFVFVNGEPAIIKGEVAEGSFGKVVRKN